MTYDMIVCTGNFIRVSIVWSEGFLGQMTYTNTFPNCPHIILYILINSVLCTYIWYSDFTVFIHAISLLQEWVEV